jgi:hypothetical protein
MQTHWVYSSIGIGKHYTTHNTLLYNTKPKL